MLKRTLLLCVLSAGLMAGMAHATERHEGYQTQVESQAVAVMPVDLAQTVTAVTAEEYEGFAPMVVTKTAVGFGEGASNDERMRPAITQHKYQAFSIASVTSPAKAPEDPGKQFS